MTICPDLMTPEYGHIKLLASLSFEFYILLISSSRLILKWS
jgi:hypothetical protein